MYISQEEMIGHLERAVAIPSGQVFFAELPPVLPPGLVSWPYPYFRFMIPLSGCKHVAFFHNNEVHDVLMTPGSIIFGEPFAGICEDWVVPHEMIGVIFHSEIIRVIYINQALPTTPRNGPDVYYHTSRPVGGAGKLVLDALAVEDIDDMAKRPLLEALLRLVIRAVRDDEKDVGGKSRATWQNIECYLHENWNRQLDRVAVADVFKLHPVHVSRLCRQFASMGFGEYVSRLRLNHAAELLRSSKMTVDEISYECGYNYSSHFIRRFKQHYGIPPTAYRNSG